MAFISRTRVRRAPTRRAPPADRPARAGWAALRQFLFREFFFEIFPATLVSRATRNRTDPLAPPAGRRRHFLNSGWGLVRPPRRRIRWCGRRRRASAARYGVDFDTTPIETALNWRVPPLYPLTRAHEVDSATRWGPPHGRRRRFHFREIRFGAAAIAASVSGRQGGAAAAGRRRWRQWVPPINRSGTIPAGGDDGARALVANAAADDVAAAAARRRRGTGSSPTGGIERPAV